jgi:3-deoxy-D-manno-octulosonate 8-phosphate phosphatase (KDO 8-P phosphatase)
MAMSNTPDEVIIRAKRIRLVCFDVDGTLTDGRLIYDSNGGELKAFHVHDGQGLRLLEDSGIAVALITARESAIVRARGQELRLKHVYTGVADKLKQLDVLRLEAGFDHSEIAYMGDDFPDLSCLQSVGLAACPSDALPAIQRHVHWCSDFAGGFGAARQLCDLILQAQDRQAALTGRFSAP